MTMAQTTTGPARGPRPTSSTPAMWREPAWRSERSRALQPPAKELRLRLARDGDLHAGLLLGDARGLAGHFAEVEELRAAHTATAHDLDLGEHRRVEREDTLDA